MNHVIILHIGDVVRPSEAAIAASPALRRILTASGQQTGVIVDIADDGEACPIRVEFSSKYRYWLENYEVERVNE